MENRKCYVIVGALEDGIGEAVTKKILSDNHQVIGTYEKECDKKIGNKNQKRLNT